jgi:hypothetical protein
LRVCGEMQICVVCRAAVCLVEMAAQVSRTTTDHPESRPTRGLGMRQRCGCRSEALSGDAFGPPITISGRQGGIRPTIIRKRRIESIKMGRRHEAKYSAPTFSSMNTQPKKLSTWFAHTILRRSAPIPSRSHAYSIRLSLVLCRQVYFGEPNITAWGPTRGAFSLQATTPKSSPGIRAGRMCWLRNARRRAAAMSVGW